jgi:hypothetical protein
MLNLSSGSIFPNPCKTRVGYFYIMNTKHQKSTGIARRIIYRSFFIGCLPNFVNISRKWYSLLGRTHDRKLWNKDFSDTYTKWYDQSLYI